MIERQYKINFPVFGYRVYVVYTDNIQDSRKKRNELVGAQKELLTEYVDGLHSYNKLEPDCFVFFTPQSTIGVIAHECYHAIRRMLKYIGAKPEEEVIAYHLTYILDEVLEFKKHADESGLKVDTSSPDNV